VHNAYLCLSWKNCLGKNTFCPANTLFVMQHKFSLILTLCGFIALSVCIFMFTMEKMSWQKYLLPEFFARQLKFSLIFNLQWLYKALSACIFYIYVYRGKNVLAKIPFASKKYCLPGKNTFYFNFFLIFFNLHLLYKALSMFIFKLISTLSSYIPNYQCVFIPFTYFFHSGFLPVFSGYYWFFPPSGKNTFCHVKNPTLDPDTINTL